MNALDLTCGCATFKNLGITGIQEPSKLMNPDVLVEVTGTGTDTVDSDLHLKLGSAGPAAMNAPVKIKAMKRRTVKVALHKVATVNEHGGVSQPDLVPAKPVLEDYLNDVFGRQVNAYFEVTYLTEGGSQGIKINEDEDYRIWGENEYSLAMPNPKSEGDAATANIDIWVTAGWSLYGTETQIAYGLAFRQKGNKILINADSAFYYGVANPQQWILHVFAHEIGHIMTQGGHVDEVPGETIGKAVLEGLEHLNKKRLLCSGPGSDFNNPGRQLIKKEWDLIEVWLEKTIKIPE